MTSPAVLDRAVTMSGSRVSAEKLAQRLKVEAVQNTNVITVRVVDSTATGAAQLADSVILASDQVVARQQARKVAEQLRSMEARCELENTLANDVVEPADRPNDDHLRNKCDAATSAQLWEARRRLLLQMDAAEFNLLQRAAVPKQPSSPDLVARWLSGCCSDCSSPSCWCGGVPAGKGQRPDPRRPSCRPRLDQPSTRPAQGPAQALVATVE